MHTRVNQIIVNTDLEIMRTLAVHLGSQLLDFLKKPNLDFLKTERISRHHPLSQRPHQTRILSSYFKENTWAPMLCPISSCENVDKSRVRPRAYHKGPTADQENGFLPLKAIWRSSYRAFHKTLERNCWRRQITAQQHICTLWR